MTNHELTLRIMRRVYVIYYARKALSRRALTLYALIAAIFGTISVVSVTNVFANMPSDFGELAGFFISAFAHTQLIVQTLAFSALAALVALLLDLARSFSGMPYVRRVS